MYHDFALKSSRGDAANYRAAARKAAARAGNGTMLEDLGLSEKENGNFASAASFLQQARSLYEKPDDIVRTFVEQARVLIEAGDRKAALALLRRVPRLAAESPAGALLRKMEEELNPPLPTPQTSP